MMTEISTLEALVLKSQKETDKSDVLWEIYRLCDDEIRAAAARYKGLGEEPEDLRQEAFFGVAKAAELWRPDGGEPFTVYVYHWTCHTLRRYIDTCGGGVRLPVYQKARLLKYRRVVSDFLRDFDRKPTARELERALEITPYQVGQLEKDALALEIQSTDEKIGGEDDDLTLGETIIDKDNGIDNLLDEIDAQELSSLLWSLVDELESKECEVIKRRFQKGEALESCGRDLGVSGERVRQIERAALRKLSHKKALQIYRQDETYSLGLKRTSFQSFRDNLESSVEFAVLELEKEKHLLRGLEEESQSL